MRLDKYLKVSRIIKRRTVANEACDAGRVVVNGKIARASYDVMRYRDLENTPLYPFGFGLHYTTFKTTVKDGTPEISIAALENGKAHTVTCEVEHSGPCDGAAVHSGRERHNRPPRARAESV